MPLWKLMRHRGVSFDISREADRVKFRFDIHVKNKGFGRRGVIGAYAFLTPDYLMLQIKSTSMAFMLSECKTFQKKKKKSTSGFERLSVQSLMTTGRGWHQGSQTILFHTQEDLQDFVNKMSQCKPRVVNRIRLPDPEEERRISPPVPWMDQANTGMQGVPVLDCGPDAKFVGVASHQQQVAYLFTSKRDFLLLRWFRRGLAHKPIRFPPMLEKGIKDASFWNINFENADRLVVVAWKGTSRFHARATPSRFGPQVLESGFPFFADDMVDTWMQPAPFQPDLQLAVLEETRVTRVVGKRTAVVREVDDASRRRYTAFEPHQFETWLGCDNGVVELVDSRVSTRACSRKWIGGLFATENGRGGQFSLHTLPVSQLASNGPHLFTVVKDEAVVLWDVRNTTSAIRQWKRPHANEAIQHAQWRGDSHIVFRTAGSLWVVGEDSKEQLRWKFETPFQPLWKSSLKVAELGDCLLVGTTAVRMIRSRNPPRTNWSLLLQEWSKATDTEHAIHQAFLHLCNEAHQFDHQSIHKLWKPGPPIGHTCKRHPLCWWDFHPIKGSCSACGLDFSDKPLASVRMVFAAHLLLHEKQVRPPHIEPTVWQRKLVGCVDLRHLVVEYYDLVLDPLARWAAHAPRPQPFHTHPVEEHMLLLFERVPIRCVWPLVLAAYGPPWVESKRAEAEEGKHWKQRNYQLLHRDPKALWETFYPEMDWCRSLAGPFLWIRKNLELKDKQAEALEVTARVVLYLSLGGHPIPQWWQPANAAWMDALSPEWSWMLWGVRLIANKPSIPSQHFISSILARWETHLNRGRPSWRKEVLRVLRR